MLTRFLAAVLALAIASSTGFAQTASKPTKPTRPAASPSGKKLTYEEAFKRCTPYAQQESYDRDTSRYLRAAACMKQFGHNI